MEVADTEVWHVYMVECADGTLYTGVTVDLERRIHEHNNTKKGAAYTRARRPVEQVYSATYGSRSLAQKAEWAIKRWPRRHKLELITGDRSPPT